MHWKKQSHKIWFAVIPLSSILNNKYCLNVIKLIIRLDFAVGAFWNFTQIVCFAAVPPSLSHIESSPTFCSLTTNFSSCFAVNADDSQWGGWCRSLGSLLLCTTLDLCCLLHHLVWLLFSVFLSKNFYLVSSGHLKVISPLLFKDSFFSHMHTPSLTSCLQVQESWELQEYWNLMEGGAEYCVTLACTQLSGYDISSLNVSSSGSNSREGWNSWSVAHMTTL